MAKPGPIVEETVTFFRNLPFEVAGLAADKLFIKATKLSKSLFSSKETLPIENALYNFCRS